MNHNQKRKIRNRFNPTAFCALVQNGIFIRHTFRFKNVLISNSGLKNFNNIYQLRNFMLL